MVAIHPMKERRSKCDVLHSTKNFSYKPNLMKPKQTLITKIFLPLIFILAAMVQPKRSAANIFNGDEKKTKKERAAKMNSTVKVVPDIIKKAMHVKSTNAKEISFFVFDMQGNMVLSYKLKKGEKKTISGLP